VRAYLYRQLLEERALESLDRRFGLIPAAVVFAACLAVPAAAMAAGGFCSQPGLPSCVSAGGGFDSEDDKARCRYHLDSYLSAIERRANCVLRLAEEEARQRVEEGRREAEEVRDEGREAEARFGCKARGSAC
jgi:hypothetical protein